MSKHIIQQNTAVAATCIEVGAGSLRLLAGGDLSGAEMKDLEDIFGQELHNEIMEQADAE